MVNVCQRSQAHYEKYKQFEKDLCQSSALTEIFLFDNNLIIISQEIRIKHLNILANPAKTGDANG